MTTIAYALHAVLADLEEQERLVRAHHVEGDAAVNEGLTPLLVARVSVLTALAALGEGSAPGRGWYRLQIDVKPPNGWEPRVDLQAFATALTPLFGDGSLYDGARITAS